MIEADPIHVFTLPSRDVTAAIEAHGMHWSYCNDVAQALAMAVLVFHIGSVPLDTAGARFKCVCCGRRSATGAEA